MDADIATFEDALAKAQSMTFPEPEVRGGRTDAQWSTRDLLVSLVCTLEELLAETKRGNSIERTGAVSSASIKTSTRGHDCEVKAYVGSDVEAAVDAALDAYGRMVREANERAMNGWAEVSK